MRAAFPRSDWARCTGGGGRLLPTVRSAFARGPTGPSAYRPHPRITHATRNGFTPERWPLGLRLQHV